mmetsp:Transcript_10214/g.33630  ORF Transcript_10214/g.33630 Transcript_10214/m.33630 type:complete len:360 (-) Transcript_10214:100-1179(-)
MMSRAHLSARRCQQRGEGLGARLAELRRHGGVPQDGRRHLRVVDEQSDAALDDVVADEVRGRVGGVGVRRVNLAERVRQRLELLRLPRRTSGPDRIPDGSEPPLALRQRRRRVAAGEAARAAREEVAHLGEHRTARVAGQRVDIRLNAVPCLAGLEPRQAAIVGRPAGCAAQRELQAAAREQRLQQRHTRSAEAAPGFACELALARRVQQDEGELLESHDRLQLHVAHRVLDQGKVLHLPTAAIVEGLAPDVWQEELSGSGEAPLWCIEHQRRNRAQRDYLPSRQVLNTAFLCAHILRAVHAEGRAVRDDLERRRLHAHSVHTELHGAASDIQPQHRRRSGEVSVFVVRRRSLCSLAHL